VGIASATAVAIAIGAPPMVAAQASLTNASVSPRSGTTATLYTFTVVSSGKPAPNRVQVRLTGPAPAITFDLSGPAPGQNGTWRGTRRITTPGRWSVTFFTSKTSVGGGSIAVSAAPQPTPRPTPTPRPAPQQTPGPTPRPTAKPTASPTAQSVASAGASATPPSTPIAIGGATETSPSPTAAAIASTAGNQTGSLLLAVLLGVLVLVGVGGIALLAGRRRAEEEPMARRSVRPPFRPPAPVVPDREIAAFAARVAPAPPPESEPTPQPRGAWDAYADIDDRPIGTVDQLPPGDYQRRPHGEG
jgi:hypothetical protein